MTSVNGVLGAIDTADLGFVYPHEHVLVGDETLRKAFSDWASADDVIPPTVEAFKQIKTLGVDTIVDCTPINLGRDIDLMRQVAEQSGMQIIASTGFYYHEIPSLRAWGEDAIANLMIRDINEGIEGTDAKAGIIKCATDMLGMTPTNALLFRAVAKAHRATGVPITTHTNAAEKTGFVQQAVLAFEGVDLSRVVIGHCGDSEDMDYLQRLLDKGSYIGMDRFGLDRILPTEPRARTVAALCKKGYADQLLLSHDKSGFIDWSPPDSRIVLPYRGFPHIKTVVIPMLLEMGVTDAQIETMTVHNPRRLFEVQGAY